MMQTFINIAPGLWFWLYKEIVMVGYQKFIGVDSFFNGGFDLQVLDRLGFSDKFIGQLGWDCNALITAEDHRVYTDNLAPGIHQGPA